MTDDVRDLLGKAFGQEPPLRIDRDEVIQQGRKRLRRRRVFEASSVVAAVLVVAVGAVTLTNLAGSEQQKKMPPAASSTGVAPPGPVLPLPETSAPASETMTKAPTAPPLTTVLTPPPSFPGRYQLTDLLYSSGIVTEKDVAPVGSPPRVPEFHLKGAQYAYEADIIRQERPGFLQVTIDFTVRAKASCDTVPAGFGSCISKYGGGVPVTISTWRGDDGERRILVITVLEDGTRVAALSSNMPSQFRKNGRAPDDTVPPALDSDELCALVAKVGLSAR